MNLKLTLLLIIGVCATNGKNFRGHYRYLSSDTSLWLPCEFWHLLYPFSLILVKMDDGIECWVCDHLPTSVPGNAGECRDENDKGKMQKCGDRENVCMTSISKGKEYRDFSLCIVF